ncbi:hypothetical protein GCM10025871_41720 [Deinococcus metallilatus]|nr:hypothetical protein GCM10025871_41720 [Deinococcus metallilatus]
MYSVQAVVVCHNLEGECDKEPPNRPRESHPRVSARWASREAITKLSSASVGRCIQKTRSPGAPWPIAARCCARKV